MPEIIKVYRQTLPKCRFIGKKHDNPAAWGEWFQNGWFDVIEKAVGEEKLHALYEDGDAYVGLMSMKSDKDMSYWIGMFTAPDTAVPEGYISMDFEETPLGVCWMYGKENELYQSEGECYPKLIAEGMKPKKDADGADWAFERYGCPRFTTPDEKGNVILDYCVVIE